jgi:cytochrome c biogenesis protein CcmG/thiol:disulfide interchange protein DsbE
MRKILFFFPLILALVLALVLAKALLEPRRSPTEKLGYGTSMAEPLPSLPRLPLADEPDRLLEEAYLKKGTHIVHFFASWCGPCRAEHPLMMQLSKRYPDLPVTGIAWKDKPEQAVAWLDKLGNPYRFTVDDEKGVIGINLGITGTPEFFILHEGKLVYHFAGPLAQHVLEEEIYPLLVKLMPDNPPSTNPPPDTTATTP